MSDPASSELAGLADQIDVLRDIVKNLASQVRTDRKIIMATQAFTTTLADNLDLLEENLIGRMNHVEARLLATTSGISRAIRAALDGWDESAR